MEVTQWRGKDLLSMFRLDHMIAKGFFFHGHDRFRLDNPTDTPSAP